MERKEESTEEEILDLAERLETIPDVESEDSDEDRELVVSITPEELVAAFGVNDTDVAGRLAAHAMVAIPGIYAEQEADIEVVTRMLKEFKPQDGVEAMLASQALVLHFTALKQLSGVRNAEYIEQSKSAVVYGTRLVREFGKVLETLDAYRGKTKNQKIVVERVDVSDGGQAIVAGSVEGGNDKTNR